jgi:ankyrin repeat protein
VNHPETLVNSALAGDDAAVRAALAQDPASARASIHVAAAVADADAVFALLEADPSLADRHGGARDWTPLLYLCCSRFGRSDRDVIAARLTIAWRLIELGADVNALGKTPGYTSDSVGRGFDDCDWCALAGAANPVASLELVRLLVFSGGAIARTRAILTHAVRGGDIEILRFLLEMSPGEWFELIWALRASVVVDRPDMARMVSARVATPTMRQPALMEAIRLQRGGDMIGAVLEEAGTSDLDDAVRRKVYRQAVRYGHEAAAELLRRAAADADLTAIDRAIGACMTLDRAELQRLLAGSSYSSNQLRAGDHRMVSWAIRSGRHAAVPLLLEAGLDPNVPDADGDMPLHLAVRAGSVELVAELLRAGAEVNARNFEAQTALDLALTHADPGVRERLTARLRESGATVSERKDLSDLFERAADAVAFGDLDALGEMLDAEPALVHARSPRPHRCTLLNYSGANGTEAPRQRTPPNAPEIARFLLERGADPNATCKLYGGGSTTLGLLLTSAHPPAAGLDGELVRVLAQFGARLEDGLMGAIEYGLSRAVAAFVEAGVPIDNLFVAAGLDRLDVMQDMLSRGVDINTRYPEAGDGTALHAAAAMGHERAVTFLLERGADTTIHNRWDSTPAGTASFFKHPAVAELIKKARS